MAFSLYAVATFAFVVASLAEDPAAVSAPEPAAAEPGQAPSTWGQFVYCSCGLTCEEEVRTWHIFVVGKACGCRACPEGNATSLRGRTGQATAPGTEIAVSAPAEESRPESKVPEARIAETPAAAAPLKEAVLAKVVKEGPEEEALAWDSARLAASNLFYCKCGKYCVDSRGINLWNPLCFRYACRPC